MSTKCFVVKPTLDAFLWLRIYTQNKPCPGVPGEYSYHQNWTRIGIIPNGYKLVTRKESAQLVSDSDAGSYLAHNFDEIPRTDPRWPKHCEKCSYVFEDEDCWQNFTDRMYMAADAGAWPKRELPPGAMYFEDWLPRKFYWDNKEDSHLIVILPNGLEWNIDSRANNCTLPKDRLHRCWIRTGEPPNITAGKQGETCAAGAGSILAGNYHGFLRNGVLT